MNAKQEPFPQLGKYQILEKIGEGGFGRVFHAIDPQTDRHVAIKVLHQQFISSPDILERFQQEYSLAAALEHPNIVKMLEAGETDGAFYFVMEYLPGKPLNVLLGSGAPISLSDTVKMLLPLAAALDYAHQQGIIHRDLKPSNLVLDAQGLIVLTDFGLVKSLSQTGKTTTGTVIGTVEYMAPEQIMGQPASPATDRYALAIIAYQMLTGQVPFRGASPFEIQEGHVHKEVQDPRLLNPELSAEVKTVFQHALAKKPEDRFASATEFIQTLRNITDREKIEQAQTACRVAQAEMEKYNFEAAIQQLDEAANIFRTQEIDELYKECKRRNQVIQKLAALNETREVATLQLIEISEAEKWLPPEKRFHEEPSKIPVSKPSIWYILTLLASSACLIISIPMQGFIYVLLNNFTIDGKAITPPSIFTPIITILVTVILAFGLLYIGARHLISKLFSTISNFSKKR